MVIAVILSNICENGTKCEQHDFKMCTLKVVTKPLSFTLPVDIMLCFVYW